MINSISKELNTIEIPYFDGKISMLPFDLNDLSNIPEEFKTTVEKMLQGIKDRTGQAYLTVHGKFVKKDETLRRPAPHIDGNYLNGKWGSEGGGNGWKVGENGQELTTLGHKLSYDNVEGGMLITSNYSACRGWNGKFKGKAGIGGDCRHIKLKDSFILEPNKVYYGNSQFIHESLPLDKDVHRVLFRITLPINHNFEN